MNAQIRMLTGPAARLAIESSVRGVRPTVPLVGSVLSGRVLGYDLGAASHTAIELDASGSIVLRAEGLEPSERIEPHPNRSEARLTLDTGDLYARWSDATLSRYGPRHDVTFRLDRWEWTTGRRPVAWIGALRGARVWRGNMTTSAIIDDQETGANSCECFEGGGLRWMIVPRAAQGGQRGEELCDAIIEPLDGEIDANRVRDALRAVAFVLGRKVGLDLLLGVDETLEVVAAIATQHGVGCMTPGGERRPLPQIAERAERWDAELFRRLADRIRADEAGDADVTHIATSAHLDAGSDHIEGAYLKLQIALEAFCGRASPVVEEVRVDRKVWLSWVDSHAEEIGQLVGTAAQLEPLLNSMKALYRASSSRTVERFFERNGVTLPRQLRRELTDGRNAIAHQYTLGPYSPDFENELEQVAVTQTLLVAALALFIGYEGPIANGRDWYSSPEWWPFKPREAPGTVLFRCVDGSSETQLP